MPPPSSRHPARTSALIAALALSAALSSCSGTSGPPRSDPAPATPPVAPSQTRATPSAVAKVHHAGPALHRTNAWLAAMRQRRIEAQNPLAGRPWGVYGGDGEMAWAPYVRAGGETRELLGKIALAPKAKWFGGWISDAAIADKVRGYIASAQQQAGSADALVQMSVFRMHPWEDEACHRLPTAAESASYRTWIERFASAVGDAHAAIILQPDGPFALCAPHGSHTPSDLIAFAARTLSALPHASVYIDVGAADWPIESQGGVAAATRIAIQDGVRYARGIALNTTHYSSTVDEVQRGADVVRALAAQGIRDKHFVVNTSSNGKGFVFGDYRGPDPDNARVCESQQDPGPCVALGIPPTYDFDDPAWGLPRHTVELAQRYADAFLWIGRPWLYDQKEPFVLSRALTLARVSRW
ncbi:MAG TPA: glycoside hydrolase family 6 protein [Nocardioides sp.]|uniref:glycoside hydrolase family 6 protein n=1 Tax=Nocardioides sp. TaxID=35761 RepID=UPI002E36307D|nr:glycoside hydrolase family 6 protein [Nocardioides sp.]HEX5089069.1 glycoside hydrolase family 6 protein [Nocardioides sp.]